MHRKEFPERKKGGVVMFCTPCHGHGTRVYTYPRYTRQSRVFVRVLFHIYRTDWFVYVFVEFLLPITTKTAVEEERISTPHEKEP